MTDESRYTERFWEALAEDRFLLGDCQDCEKRHFPPAPVCPHCHAEAGWMEAAGTGTLYSFTRQNRTAPAFDSPITIGTVELAEGPRLLVRIDADYESLSIGRSMSLEAVEYDQEYDRGDLAEYPMFVAKPD